MCLVLLARSTGPNARFSLALAANRDEMHQRASAPLAWWAGPAGIAGGRDLVAGGSWLAVSRSGRFATVLNDPSAGDTTGTRSRGTLVSDCLQADDFDAWMRDLAGRVDQYGGFHLLAGDAGGCRLLSSRNAGVRELAPGRHAIGNPGAHGVGPRGETALRGFAPALSAPDPVEALLAVLADERPPGDGKGDTRPVFIRGERFGTRCSTVVLMTPAGRVGVHERRHDSRGHTSGETSLAWCVS